MRLQVGTQEAEASAIIPKVPWDPLYYETEGCQQQQQQQENAVTIYMVGYGTYFQWQFRFLETWCGHYYNWACFKLKDMAILGAIISR